jgi:hypothetical protein
VVVIFAINAGSVSIQSVASTVVPTVVTKRRSMLGIKTKTTPDKGPFEQEWRRWYPHDDDPPELAEWDDQHREFIFEQLMKTHKNLPRDEPLPGMANVSNFNSSIAVWTCMVIAMIVLIAAQAFFR